MRLSVYEEDPGHHQAAVSCRVFFNGVEAKYVFTADEELGMIVQAVRDDQGRLQLAAGGVRLVTQELRGHVRIEVPPELKSLFHNETPTQRTR